jgi:hypothetical protein
MMGYLLHQLELRLKIQVLWLVVLGNQINLNLCLDLGQQGLNFEFVIRTQLRQPEIS